MFCIHLCLTCTIIQNTTTFPFDVCVFNVTTKGTDKLNFRRWLLQRSFRFGSLWENIAAIGFRWKWFCRISRLTLNTLMPENISSVTCMWMLSKWRVKICMFQICKYFLRINRTILNLWTFRIVAFRCYQTRIFHRSFLLSIRLFCHSHFHYFSVIASLQSLNEDLLSIPVPMMGFVLIVMCSS